MVTVYLLQNKINGKRYVGITKFSAKHRWYRHVGAAKNGVKTAIAGAIRKHGPGNFDLSVLDECETIGEALQREKELIVENDSRVEGFGYNLTEGGEHYTLSEEARKRISERTTGHRTNAKNNELARARAKTGNMRRYKWLLTEEIVALYHNKHSTVDIAKQFGVNKTTIQRRLVKAGIPLGPRW